jgi:hypothetical protein
MATKGFKTTFGYGAAGEDGQPGSGPFTNLAKVLDINGVSVEAEDIETSNMDSVEAWKTFTAGWGSVGDVELKLQFDKDSAGDIYGLFRLDKTFQVKFVDGSTWVLAGFMKKFGNEVEREKLVTVSVTVKCSGKPVFTPAE